MDGFEKIIIFYALDCGSASIANGGVTFLAGTEYNDVATVRCDDGYWISGSKTLTCLSSGRWTADTECVVKGMFLLF